MFEDALSITNKQSPVGIPLEIPPFSLNREEKLRLLLPKLNQLTKWHYQECTPYRNVIDSVFGGIKECSTIEELPFIPVRMFKQLELKSLPSSDIIKVLTSSGTTGQQVSKIYLDGTTARNQSAVLVKIMQHCLGKKRLPMVIIDSEDTVKNRHSFSARSAGILGMMQFGFKPFYALNSDMSLKVDELLVYLKQFEPTDPVLLFGFTFMVWLHFIRVLEQLKVTLSLPRAILVHSGGWKKLYDQAVTAQEFNNRLKAVTGITSAYNFYGMVEQVGSIFLENNRGYLNAPIFSDVVIRDPFTLAPLPIGQPGLIQVVSMLPWSYPGHSLLTEDIGILRGEGDVGEETVGGRYFEVLGRVPKAEVRGCSDTYQV